MNQHAWFALAFAALTTVASCAGVPRLPIATANGQPTNEVTSIMQEVACEMAHSEHVVALRQGHYVVAAALTLKAKDNVGLSPSLSFIHPFHTPMTSQTTALNGAVARSRSAQFTQNFLVAASGIREAQPCPSGDGRSGLSGDIGLDDIITAGLSSNSAQIQGVHFATPQNAASDAPTFGTTVEFVFERSLNFGPTWSRVRFRGPNGQNPMIGTGRSDTSTLVLAFAPGSAGFSATEDRHQDEQAARSAQALLTQMLLQNATLGR